LYALAFEEISKEDSLKLEKYVQEVDIEAILRSAIKQNASDIHLVANQPYFFRINGEIIPVGSFPIPSDDLRKLILSMLTEQQKEVL